MAPWPMPGSTGGGGRFSPWRCCSRGHHAGPCAARVARLLRLDSEHDQQVGAQEINGAWAANLGFLLFGFGVLWTVRVCGDRWPSSGAVLHGLFGVCMITVASFSIRSWETGATYDSAEDVLHSIAATVMGFAFAIGVVVVAGARRAGGGRVGLLDVLAVVASVAIPIAMTTTDSAGILQRLMSLTAYLWYGSEVGRGRSLQVQVTAGADTAS